MRLCFSKTTPRLQTAKRGTKIVFEHAKKALINLSLKYYLADSNGIISATRAPTTDKLNFVKVLYITPIRLSMGFRK